MESTRIVVFIIHILAIAGCVAAPIPTDCVIVSNDDGWVSIAEPPPSLSHQLAERTGRVVLWFANADRTIVKACDRPTREGLCSEEVTTYELKGDDWIESELMEILTCTG